AAARHAAVPAATERDLWLRFLDDTRHPDFLTALPDAAARLRWAELVFRVVEDIGFSLGDLLVQRAAAQGDHVLFRDLTDQDGGDWSYAAVLRRVRETAAVLLRDGRPAGSDRPPRVALLNANSVGAACADLACLCHDIPVAPLDVHASVENLVWIVDRLDVTAVVCDTPDRVEKLLAVRDHCRARFRIFTLHPCRPLGSADIRLLDEQRALLSTAEVDAALAARPRLGPRDPATVMFTSGSTGRPKGVVFSQLNLVSKRFARAAALPFVGRDEVLLCYLPLHHTFGRYLEMLGTIFWGGTYVFAGNPSADSLLGQLAEVRPTALISVPVRWVQIRDRVVELQRAQAGGAEAPEVFRAVVGDRLAWGLSAAGWLDPKVFRFFHRMGVRLCSGFGMTEGTGGLTMTPPDEYEENSVGVPLPGVKVTFGEQEELKIAGVYIARYLPDDGAPGDLTVENPESDDHWLATGDLFRQTPGGQLEIVDRIKDIYKNNRGQTIAPRRVESLFEGVPGIRRTFLAGDGRSYNTLLIVPDPEDPVLGALHGEQGRREYFRRIVTAANGDLAPFERVVNFAVLERDFTAARGELTPKGSLRRKNIETGFRDVIEGMYRTREPDLAVGAWQVRIPRWFYRDLGVLETAIVADPDGLRNNQTGAALAILPGRPGWLRIGDLEYRLKGPTVDLGLLVRQPLLWLANPQLEAFGPCLLGWDTDLGPFSEQVALPRERRPDAARPGPAGAVDRQVAEVDLLCRQALFGPDGAAVHAVAELDSQLEHVGLRQGAVIRRRLEALAWHPAKAVRSRAFQVLVLDEPVPDYQRYLPAFIESGQPFLDDEGFAAIAAAAIEPRRLQSLRQRLHSYRDQLAWPADESVRGVFRDLFRLLADFGRFHPEFYTPIREELVSWALHDADPELAAAAEQEFAGLSRWFEAKLEEDGGHADPAAWQGRIVFQEGLGEAEVARLREVLVGTTFLKESVLLAFEGEQLRLAEIGPGGIWVSRIISRYEDARYRVSINTRAGKHFDLQLIIRVNVDQELVRETIFWYIALRGYPFGTPMLPKFGCCRPELGALSMAYVSDLTVWEKIREFSSVRGPGTTPPSRMRWHQLMVRAMSVVVKGWRNSDRRIIPGLITPNNIVVPEPDFRRGAVQNNLTGWHRYDGPLSLIRPIWRNMYQHTISHYPWTREYLERAWIFEAVVEALGVGDALAWLRELQAEVRGPGAADLGLGFNETLDAFVAALETRYYEPLALQAAVHRYEDWERVNGQATARAKLEILDELNRLFRLDREPPIVRFTLFRRTYFRNADLRLLDIFDRLLIRIFRHPDRRFVQMVELSELQAALADPDDRLAFNRLAFPHRLGDDRIELRTIGDPERDHVVVRSTVTDREGLRYTIGEPAGPAEVGLLYRLFLQAGYPVPLGEGDHHYVVTDEAEQIIGGLVYRAQDAQSVFLDGIVVTPTLSERGIAAAVLDDFCTRMAARDYRHVKTHFFLRRFYQKHGFRTDVRWGGLVRLL
ncbi:MAG: GNAT family N-acetyltransferase, partial [Krumholzibacteria bacterium]|nr:GNAT family N-acetyltransferase [Candidatus Krumholzibacteria bacterium]